MRPDFTKVEHFLNENMENISIISKTFPGKQAGKLKTEIQNNHLSHINDNGDNNEKTKCLKI